MYVFNSDNQVTQLSQLLRYVPGFAKRGLPRASNLPTLTLYNLRLQTANALNLGEM